MSRDQRELVVRANQTGFDVEFGPDWARLVTHHGTPRVALEHHAGKPLHGTDLVAAFVAGRDWARAENEAAEQAAYERGVEAAWSDIKKRLAR